METTFNTTYKATGPTKSSIKVTACAPPSELHTAGGTTTKETERRRLHKAVNALCLQAGTDTSETVEWLCGPHGGMAKLFAAYFSPAPTGAASRTTAGLCTANDGETK